MSEQQTEIRVFPDAPALCHFGAGLFVEAATEAVRQRGRLLAALCGGGTPLGLYRDLAEPPFRDRLPWSLSHFFWGDERCVPPTDPGSNYLQTFQTLLSRVPVPEANIHRARGELEPAMAAEAYKHELLRFADPGLEYPRFDLVLLGLGADGHTASLFPGSTDPPSAVVEAVHAQYEGRPADRVTLTPRVFNAARQVVFLVSGEEKAAALAAVLAGRRDPLALPAQRIRPTEGKAWWLIDEGAAKYAKIPVQGT